jgi:hypothetical protein
MRSGSHQGPSGRQNSNRTFRPQPHTPQRAGGGPNPQSRGNAHQAFERYVALAREATIEGDRVAAENFYQHAEHYFRTANESRDGAQQRTAPRPNTPAEVVINPRSTDPDAERILPRNGTHTVSANQDPDSR